MFDFRLFLKEGDVPAGRYAYAFEADGFEVLIDPTLFWGPPRVLVRGAGGEAEIWLDEDYVALTRPSVLSPDRARLALELVERRVGALTDLWFELRNDAALGRLSRHAFVD